MKIYIEI